MLCTLPLAALLLASSPAADDLAARLPFATSLHAENDLLAQSDRFYTNGVRIEHLGEHSACRTLAAALGFPGGLEHRYLCGASISQNIYTPSRIVPRTGEVPWPPPDDRPYGGWLHAGPIFRHVAVREDPRASTRLTLQATLGVTGPASGAGFAQTAVHTLIRNIAGGTRPYDPVGWESQLPTEPAFFFSALHEQPLLFTQHVDAAWSAGGMLGSIFANASLGAMVRVGWLARPFGVSPIIPSLRDAGILPAGGPAERSWEVYLYFRSQARLVVRNFFLDGNLFRRSASVRKAPLVGDTEAGLSLRLRHFEVDFALVHRTQEMADPSASIPGHRFGMLRLGYLH